ncbi:hypothetical protein GMMP15_610001 [Candidatus Magnetomoraceae bacterium gMMP-15]
MKHDSAETNGRIEKEVLITYPLKQGLKHLNQNFIEQIQYMVLITYPLKQGLKPLLLKGSDLYSLF